MLLLYSKQQELHSLVFCTSAKTDFLEVHLLNIVRTEADRATGAFPLSRLETGIYAFFAEEMVASSDSVSLEPLLTGRALEHSLEHNVLLENILRIALDVSALSIRSGSSSRSFLFELFHLLFQL